MGNALFIFDKLKMIAETKNLQLIKQLDKLTIQKDYCIVSFADVHLWWLILEAWFVVKFLLCG